MGVPAAKILFFCSVRVGFLRFLFSDGLWDAFASYLEVRLGAIFQDAYGLLPEHVRSLHSAASLFALKDHLVVAIQVEPCRCLQVRLSQCHVLIRVVHRCVRVCVCAFADSPCQEFSLCQLFLTKNCHHPYLCVH